MDTLSVATALTLVSVGGFYLAYLYGRKTKRFRWSEYVPLLAAPVGSIGVLAYVYNTKILYLFVVSAVIGLLFEYGVGKFYHMTLNRRLWTYSRYSLNGYTSWLAAPMWGIAGVVFWLLSSGVGL